MLFIIAIIPFTLLVTGLAAQVRRKIFCNLLKSNEKFSIWFNETLNGIEVIKLWNLRSKKIKEFDELQASVIKDGTRIDYVDDIGQRISMLIKHFFNNIEINEEDLIPFITNYLDIDFFYTGH